MLLCRGGFRERRGDRCDRGGDAVAGREAAPDPPRRAAAGLRGCTRSPRASCGRSSKEASTHATGPAVYVYLLFAWVLLPVVVPVAIMAVGATGPCPAPASPGFVAIGAVASVYLAVVARSRATCRLIPGDTSCCTAAPGATPTPRLRCTSSRRAARRCSRATGPSSGSGSPTWSRSPCHRDGAGRRPHVNLVFVGRGRQRVDLLPGDRVALVNSRSASDVGAVVTGRRRRGRAGVRRRRGRRGWRR